MALPCTCGPLSLRNAEFIKPASSKLLKFSGPSGARPLFPSRRCRHAGRVQSVLHGAEGPLQHAANALNGMAAGGPSALDHIAAKLTVSLMTVADTAASSAAQAVGEKAAEAVTSSATAVQSATDAAAEVVQRDNGWFGFFTGPFETVLKVLDSGLDKLHVPYSYGFSIILLTIFVKALTFPLSKKQVESTVAIQALQPRVKEIQERYKGRDPQEAQIEVAKLYQEAKVNPLAGCLPTLITLPVWIGLYRALSNVADEGLLSEGFFWIPSLAGPTTLAAQKAGAGSWLFPLVNGAPPIGWHDASAYLILPVLLVVSQYVSQKIISPPSEDPSQQSAQWILKFLPLMIGWFSLNVPSGLTIYWFINNVLSTAQQIWLKKTIQPPALASASTGTVVNSRSSVEDLRPTGKDLNARRSPKASPSGDVIDVTPEQPAARSEAPKQGSRGKKKGEKFRALKAQEAAKKAAQFSQRQQGGNDVPSRAPTTTQTKEASPKVPDAPPSKDNSTNGSS
ncbi:Inner membrane protein PPF-1, chloroplastic [Coccomyxa sp. Obi]|nr:Inner membrane protein PPF-1, chloroplastic [Coccomyxa sp. Obi]